MKFKNFLKSKIFILLTLGLFLRLFLSFFGTLELDFNTFVAWSNILARGNLANFYNSWSDYLPGYLYVLWGLGELKNSVSWLPPTFLFKLPAILADVATAGLIYLIVKKIKNERLAQIASAIYLFNPAVLANSTLWGQVDSLTALFSLLSVYLATSTPYLSAVFLALGVAIKPQAALAAGVVLFVMLRDKWKILKAAGYIALSFSVFILTFIPFAGRNSLIPFVYQRLMFTLNQYPYGSVNAFNFWGLFGFWQPDGGDVSPILIGAVTIVFIFIVGFMKFRKREYGQYLLMTILFLAGFLFQTRMHERHLLPVLAPLAVSLGLVYDLALPYIVLSLTYLANLSYSYVWISSDFKTIFSFDFIKLVITVNLISFIYIFKVSLSNKKKVWVLSLVNFWHGYFKDKRKTKPGVETFRVVNLSRKKIKYLFWALIAFSFITRLAWLGSPTKEYFDEVYHAFTARLVLHGDPKAWEWWNPHPEGFAYEWTHPPLAKLGMALGMKLWGENSFGWRFPGAILGTGCVILIYLLAKHLFKDEILALISAAVFSLDGLALTMSRIGMNDTYMLFFSLLSIYLFLTKKDFMSALAFGLAISSKWSAIWMAPILGLVWLTRKDKFRPQILWFFVIPIAVYLACYLQMFLTGHDLETFWGMQKQMWWYHTGLKATHPYTSAWWSWPFLLRPVYLYTSDEIGGMVSRIYNLGNPAVFWFGLVSVVNCFIFAYLKRNKNLALVVFSYLIFFVPWAASPRIMFFYHYLPSLPFLAIASGYVLRKMSLKLAISLLAVGLVVFIYFYPHWAGLSIPLWLDKSYYWFSSWR